jgi:hypothetical protein
MKRLPKRATNRALTVLEVLVVVAVIAMVAAMVLPMRYVPDKTPSTACLSHLKQIDLGFLLYAEDNAGKFPMQVSITNGGTMEFLNRNQTFPHYQKLSQYIRDMEVLRCPADKNRQSAANYLELADSNLSYFLNADVSTNNPAESILAGDRNLQANGQPVSAGLFTLTTNLDMSWTRELHLNSGGLGFADGHAEFSRKTNLNSLVKRQNVASSRFSIP